MIPMKGGFPMKQRFLLGVLLCTLMMTTCGCLYSVQRRTEVPLATESIVNTSPFEGEWYNAENPYEHWEFCADGTAEIKGVPCTYTVEYDGGNILLTIDDGASYIIFPSKESLMLSDADDQLFTLHSAADKERYAALKLQYAMNVNSELFAAYPDSDGWMETQYFGDIPLLADVDYIKKYSKEGIFPVSTPEELASFCYYVNTQQNAYNLLLELQNDIDLSGYAWAPMGWGTVDYSHPFRCFVDGKGHTIRNMTIETTAYHGGFLGWENYASVYNITFENALVDGGTSSGIIVGEAICGDFTDCHISGTVNCGRNAGSMFGYEANCTITDCTADVLVNGEEFPYLSWNDKEKAHIFIEDPLEITIDDTHTVHRPDENPYANLGWLVKYNGVEVLDRSAQKELEFQYPGTEPGLYEICLTAYVEGQYVPVSNTVSYEITE